MKLNYKRTILVGMAFFLIMAFWQAYDAIVPLILNNHFGLPQTVSGAVMSIDNVLAVFLLPLFGSISDRMNTKHGRRTPFILVGSIVAIVAFVSLTFIDNYQLSALMSKVTNPDTVVGEAEAGIASEIAVSTALKMTKENPLPFVGFIATLLVVLVAMATFRSPAVALMPDVTVKPLRSKANAIINLTGTAGGILVLALGMVFGTSKNKYMQYTPYVIAVVALMLTGLIIFLLTVKEKKWSAEMEKASARLEEPTSVNKSDDSRKLSGGEFKSLILILASVALWYVGYNSITSKYSLYATNVLGFDFNFTLIVAQAAAIVAYIPVGIISSKIGRRKCILAGIIMLAGAFCAGIFINSRSPEYIMFPLFALAGIGWATINVNSFPMVVELAKGGDVGKYTGYYYTASMSAQIVAPILSGVIFDLVKSESNATGMEYTFFTFGAIFVALSFITMLLVKHGDSKPIQKGALESLDVGDD